MAVDAEEARVRGERLGDASRLSIGRSEEHGQFAHGVLTTRAAVRTAPTTVRPLATAPPGTQRDLQHAFPLAAEHIERVVDVGEAEAMRDQGAESTRRCSIIAISRRMRSLPPGHSVVTMR